MEISSISYDPVQGMGDQVNFVSFSIDMGYCSSDELDPIYDTNYISGSKVRVFERTSAYTVNAVFPWTEIVLDTPFVFDPTVGNLIIEIQWPDGDAQIYSFDYATAGISLVTGAYGAGSGNGFTQAPHLLIQGEDAFSQMTFAGIKATFQ